MAEFNPVETVSDFRGLDEAEMLEGYLDGMSGTGVAGSDRSRSYWHGWHNGRVDGGFEAPSVAQMTLAAAFESLQPDYRC